MSEFGGSEEMMRDSLNALVRRDWSWRKKFLAMADAVYHYRDQIFRDLRPTGDWRFDVVFPAFELILVAKNLERIARPRNEPRRGCDLHCCRARRCAHPTVDRPLTFAASSLSRS